MPPRSLKDYGFTRRRWYAYLTDADWARLDREAVRLGVMFCTLADGVLADYAHSLKEREQADSSEAIAALARGFNEAH